MPVPLYCRSLARSLARLCQAFAAPGTPAATTATMESIVKLRDELIYEVIKAKASQPGVAAAVDRYAPQLHRIIQSIDASVSLCMLRGLWCIEHAWPRPIAVCGSVFVMVVCSGLVVLTHLAYRPPHRAQTDPVRLTQRMQFQWTSALNMQALTEFKTQEVSDCAAAMHGRLSCIEVHDRPLCFRCCFRCRCSSSRWPWCWRPRRWRT